MASLTAASAVTILGAGETHAQLTIPVLEPVIPFNYSRGRNVSVTERDRPEYQAVGINTGGFTLFPKVTVGTGITDNVFQTNLKKRTSAFFDITPSIQAVSNWSRNSLQADAGADIRRYARYSIRDESGWHVHSIGQLELGSDSTIAVSAGTARKYETRFSGSTPADIASATPYQLSNGQLQSTSDFGRLRLIAIANVSNADFKPITLLSGARVNQDYRNRNVYTGTGQIDYALTPDVSIFGQFGYTNTRYYDTQRFSLNDRSSQQYRAIGGISLDLTAVIRGSFGIGYSNRNYRSPTYKSVSGLTFETRFEYFFDQLTTFTLAGRRSVEDASIAGTSGYFNTGVGARVDHEVLRNLILKLGADYEHDSYRGIKAYANIFVVSGGAHYLFSRSLGVSLTGSYGKRSSNNLVTGPIFKEATGLISLFVQR